VASVSVEEKEEHKKDCEKLQAKIKGTLLFFVKNSHSILKK
jgi:hypothetical protein